MGIEFTRSLTVWGAVDRDELENRKREVERRYGAWISHNLQLQDDLYTIQRGVAGACPASGTARGRPRARADRGIARARSWSVRGSLRGGTRSAGCHGCSHRRQRGKSREDAPGKGGARARESGGTAGGRPRTRPAASRDVRRGSLPGLLYHLDAPDVFQLLERMRDLCRDLVIIETRIAPYPSERREHRGRQYLGMPFPEPPPDTPPFSSDALWSSIGNP